MSNPTIELESRYCARNYHPLPVVLVTWFVLVIVAAIKASSGENYQYPFTIRFVS